MQGVCNFVPCGHPQEEEATGTRYLEAGIPFTSDTKRAGHRRNRQRLSRMWWERLSCKPGRPSRLALYEVLGTTGMPRIAVRLGAQTFEGVSQRSEIGCSLKSHVRTKLRNEEANLLILRRNLNWTKFDVWPKPAFGIKLSRFPICASIET